VINLTAVMKTKVLITARSDSPAAKDAQREIQEWLSARSISVVNVSDDDGTIAVNRIKDVQLGVVIGGDGTFLSLVRRLEKKDQFPLLGVNLGTLGFITETNREEMFSVIDAVLKGKSEEQLRPLLEVELWRKDKCVESGTIFNDAVVSKDARTSILRFDIYVGGEFFKRVRADGYIISTPTGSTAYALSTGGPILHPGVNGLVLCPICSHALSARPVVIPLDVEVELHLGATTGNVYLVCDGQINYELSTGDRIRTKSSPTCLRLVGYSRKKWSETLRTKLNMI
jgi:NAD+ kinase